MILNEFIIYLENYWKYSKSDKDVPYSILKGEHDKTRGIIRKLLKKGVINWNEPF